MTAKKNPQKWERILEGGRGGFSGLQNIYPWSFSKENVMLHFLGHICVRRSSDLLQFYLQIYILHIEANKTYIMYGYLSVGYTI